MGEVPAAVVAASISLIGIISLVGIVNLFGPTSEEDQSSAWLKWDGRPGTVTPGDHTRTGPS